MDHEIVKRNLFVFLCALVVFSSYQWSKSVFLYTLPPFINQAFFDTFFYFSISLLIPSLILLPASPKIFKCWLNFATSYSALLVILLSQHVARLYIDDAYAFGLSEQIAYTTRSYGKVFILFSVFYLLYKRYQLKGPFSLNFVKEDIFSIFSVIKSLLQKEIFTTVFIMSLFTVFTVFFPQAAEYVPTHCGLKGVYFCFYGIAILNKGLDLLLIYIIVELYQKYQGFPLRKVKHGVFLSFSLLWLVYLIVAMNDIFTYESEIIDNLVRYLNYAIVALADDIVILFIASYFLFFNFSKQKLLFFTCYLGGLFLYIYNATQWTKCIKYDECVFHGAIFAYTMLAILFTSFFTAVFYYLDKKTFISWFKFSVSYIPISIFLIEISPSTDGGWIGPSTSELVALLSFLIYIITTVLVILVRSFKKSKAEGWKSVGVLLAAVIFCTVILLHYDIW